MLQNRPHVLPDQLEACLGFVMRWQQLTGPIVAKGLEDTALYSYHPLVSLNKVGGGPQPSKATSLEEFFAFLEARNQAWPHTLNATTTHDTKRSDGVRARLTVLSEIPEEWQAHLELWSRQNAKHKQEVGDRPVPDRNEKYTSSIKHCLGRGLSTPSHGRRSSPGCRLIWSSPLAKLWFIPAGLGRSIAAIRCRHSVRGRV